MKYFGREFKKEYIDLPIKGKIKSVSIKKEYGYGEDCFPVLEVITYGKENE